MGGDGCGIAGGVGLGSVSVDGNGEGDGEREGVGKISSPPAVAGDEKQQRDNDHAFLRELTHPRPTRIAGLIQRVTMHSWPDDGMDRDGRHPLPVSRRRFLQKSAMAVAGGVLFACTGGKTTPKVSDVIPTVDTRWPIKRVIYVMLENRSFNNLFGKFPGVRGTTVGVENGVEKPLIRCPEWLPGDLPHDLAASRLCVNGGAMDGFGTGVYGSTYAYTIFDEDQIPNYWHWAREYSLSENFFASAAGPSYPNHFYFIAGSSGGVADNPENIRSPQGGRQDLQELGLRRGRGRRLRLREGRRREPHEAQHVLRVPHGRRAAHRRRCRLGVLLRRPGAAGLLLERVQRHLRRVPHGPVAPARATGRPAARRHRRERPSRRSPG